MNGILLNQGGAGAVESVNGQIGDVVLLAAEVGAIHSINGKEGTDIDLESSDLYPGLQINDDKFFYQSQQNVYTVCNIDRDGLRIGGQSLDNPDITLDIMVFNDNLSPVGTQTHKLSEKVDKKALERLQYYGDANIVPTDESYFEITENGEISLKEETKSKATTTDEYIAELTNIIIPYKIGNQIVTSIGYEAFYYCSGLTNIIIPNSITSIGYEAFRECSNLTDITIPNSVTSIGESAFFGCSSLTNITIPNSVTSIAAIAFADCLNLTDITIPNGVTTINQGTFRNCSNLTNITIPDSVTSIDESAFQGCLNLTNIIIPNNVTFIGVAAFNGCSNLTNITIPNSVTSIGYMAFEGCPENLTIICSQRSYADTYAKEKGIKVMYNAVESIIFKLQKDSDGSITDISDYDMQEEGVFEDKYYRIKNYSPIWFILNNQIYFPVAINTTEVEQFTIAIMTTSGTVERYCYSKDMGWWQDM